MKKILLITLAVVLILVGGIWLYLFIFGAPSSSQDFFADLGFGSSIQPAPFEPTNFEPEFPIEDKETGIDVNKALNLLTLKPVAGAVIVGTSTDKQVVRYVERGTGYIFEIDLQNSNESNLSDVAITQAYSAVWSPDGNAVVIISGTSINKRVQLLTWDETSNNFVAIDLAPDAEQFYFSDNNMNLYYIRIDNEGALGYNYSLSTQKPTVAFTIPFIAPAIGWSDIPLIYNRPGEKYQGYVYSLDSKNNLESRSVGGEALIAKPFYDGSILQSTVENDVLRGHYIAKNKSFDVAIPIIPEKCVAGSVSKKNMYCAYPIEPKGYLPTDWYKGVVRLQDYLWEVNLDANDPSQGMSIILSDLTKESGQNIDVIDMSTDYTHSRLLFRDKYSHNLWMYDMTVNN